MWHDMGLNRKLVAAAAAGMLAAVGVQAQSPSSAAQATTHATRLSADDPRWDAWLGCWQSEAVSDPMAAGAGLTCVVPATGAGPSAVNVLSIASGKIETRERLDASGRTRPIEQPGCKGSETAEWSPERTRVYVREDYACGDTKGTSTRLIAISPAGEWLDITGIRAGGGSINRVVKRRDVGWPAGLPPEISKALGHRQLAVSTARAAAAAPLTTADVVEALHNVDPGVVRTWIIQTGSRFALTGAQATALVQADVPSAVLQAMMGDTRSDQERAAGETSRRADDYLRSSAAVESGVMVAPGAAMMETAPGYSCPPTGCYAPAPYPMYNGYGYYPYASYPYGFSPYSPYWIPAPIIINRGESGRFRGPVGVRGPVVGHGPVGRRP